jgi:hypothetical protein
LLDTIIYIIFSVLLGISVTANIVISIKNHKLQEIAIRAAFEKFTVAKKLEEVIAENEAKKLEKDEGFLRFISESRDWAFQYIEDVQQAIKDYSENKSKKTLNALLGFLPNEDKK